MQRTSSSPLSIQNAVWQPNSCYSFEEFNRESSSGKIICVDYIAWLHHFLPPPKGTILDWLATTFAWSQKKNMKQRATSFWHTAGGTGRGCWSPARIYLILVELKKQHLVSTVDSCLEEYPGVKHCFLHLCLLAFSRWKSGFLSNLLKADKWLHSLRLKLGLLVHF